jgi:hypothetical protein
MSKAKACGLYFDELPPGAVRLYSDMPVPDRVIVPVYDATADKSRFWETDRKVLDRIGAPKEVYVRR